MKKIFVLMAMLPSIAFADASPNENKFNLNVRRLGLDWSQTNIKNAGEYQNSTVAALKATDQENIKGVFDVALEYGFNRFKWDNSLFMEYGKQTIKPYNDKRTTDESADKILFSSDLAYACWNYGAFKFGPIMRAQYETEFAGDPRQKVIRPNAGLALFDHDIFKSLYVVGVYEYDFTYADEKVNKSAVEAGWRLEYELRKGVKFTSDGYYRKYLSYSQYVPEDLKDDLSAVLRLDTNIWGDLTMGPYIKYRRAHSRQAEHYGSNTSIGVSFSYIHNFDLMHKKSE
ncbi:MAG: DUF3078 domain-containing protein [Alphaproteobacteria bacterium]|nr:DUF3078 domain-containing protein [Alphaproteobacteria bacterium]